jgi:phytoene dehydrogenase-like protein
VASDIDIHALYNYLLPKSFTPKKLLQQEKSSSAYVFYWGINKEFAELGLHNILFSDDYKKEFDYLFSKQFPTEDPTIYINITSKYCKEDAPEGCENWFVMVNVPHNKSESIHYAAAIRKNVVDKINTMLKTDIEKYIISESTLSPIDIENQTSSFGGSLYGNSSNNKFAAFLRHANFSSSIKNLFLVGGSVHPGGGIPLCLFSAKIASQLIVAQEMK